MDISGLDELTLREINIDNTGDAAVAIISPANDSGNGDLSGEHTLIESKVSDKDLIMKVNDGGSSTEVLRLQGTDPAIQFFGVAGFVLRLMTITYDGRNGQTSYTDTSGAATTTKFVPTYVNIDITIATVNNVNLLDIGTSTSESTRNCFVDGANVTGLNSIGEKGMLVCNGVFGAFNISSTDYAVNNTSDALHVVVSSDPGNNWQADFTFLGFISASA